MYQKHDNKPPHVAPKVENLQLGATYAITINPSNEWTSGQMPIEWVRRQYDQITQLCRGVELCLYVESSPTGRLHFHGIMKLINIIDYLRFVSNMKSYCTYAIKEFFEAAAETDTKVNPSGKSPYLLWHEYCTKQSKIWTPIFKSNVLNYAIEIVPPHGI